MSPIVYNLRGTAAPVAPHDTEPVNEFDRMVVILEAGKEGGAGSSPKMLRPKRQSPKC